MTGPNRTICDSLVVEGDGISGPQHGRGLQGKDGRNQEKDVEGIACTTTCMEEACSAMMVLTKK